MPPQNLNQSIYDPHTVQPFREELTRVGFRELLTPEDVDACLGELKGTALLVVNSVCGCAAGGARPGVALALQHRVIPDHLVTVFAGMERAAVERARGYLRGYPPSSPSLALLKEDEVVAVLERQNIEGQSPEAIAQALTAAFNRFCTRPGPSVPPEEFARLLPHTACGSQIPRVEGS
jgi:putative YphP/YqiW family bacilliredoxin